MEKLYYVLCKTKGIIWGPFFTVVQCRKEVQAFCDIDKNYCLPENIFEIVGVDITENTKTRYTLIDKPHSRLETLN